MISPAELDSVPAPGTILGGKYEVEGALGMGGMGVVLSARHVVLKQRVAVKLLRSEVAGMPEANERFLREAQAAVSIQNEHVARVLDVGTTEDGRPYMVMEHLAGADLGKVVRRRGPLPFDQAVDFILQAGEAIAEAHALGIVHRDLKPGNLFLSARSDGSPMVKVLDFGLSKAGGLGGPADGNLTSTGMVVGSSFYMAPEQFRGLRNADARTDIWALGVILFQLVSGRRPFDGENFGAVCASVAADPPLALRALCPDVPPGLEAVIYACLEKDKARRIQSMTELARALAPFGTPASPTSVQRIVGMGPAAPSAIPPLPPSSTPHPASSPTPFTASMDMRQSTAPTRRSTSSQAPVSTPSDARFSAPSHAPDVAEPPRAATASASGWGHTRAHARRRGAMVFAGGAAAMFLAVAGFSLVRFGSEGAVATPAAPAEAQPASQAAPELAAPEPAAPEPAAPAAAPATQPPRRRRRPTAAPTATPAARAAAAKPAPRRPAPAAAPAAKPQPSSEDALDRWK